MRSDVTAYVFPGPGLDEYGTHPGEPGGQWEREAVKVYRGVWQFEKHGAQSFSVNGDVWLLGEYHAALVVQNHSKNQTEVGEMMSRSSQEGKQPSHGPNLDQRPGGMRSKQRCPKCKGTGKIEIYDFTVYMGIRPCSYCDGTGIQEWSHKMKIEVLADIVLVLIGQIQELNPGADLEAEAEALREMLEPLEADE